MAALLRSSPSSPHTPALIYGNVLHEVVQACLRQKRWDSAFVEQQIVSHLNDVMGELLRIDIKLEDAKQAILERGKGVGIFGERYFGEVPKVRNLCSCPQPAHNASLTRCCAIIKLNEDKPTPWL